MRQFPSFLLKYRAGFLSRKTTISRQLTKQEILLALEQLCGQRRAVVEEIEAEGLSHRPDNFMDQFQRLNRLWPYLQRLHALSQRIEQLQKELSKAPSGE